MVLNWVECGLRLSNINNRSYTLLYATHVEIFPGSQPDNNANFHPIHHIRIKPNRNTGRVHDRLDPIVDLSKIITEIGPDGFDI